MVALMGAILYPVLRYISPPNIPEAAGNQVLAGTVSEMETAGWKTFPFGSERKRSLSISDEDLARVKERVDAGCPVMGLRFTEDPAVPEDRFATLRRALGDGFIAIEIDSSPGNEFGIKRTAHSVLTEDLVDEPGHPTRAALHRVLDFLESRLRP